MPVTIVATPHVTIQTPAMAFAAFLAAAVTRVVAVGALRVACAARIGIAVTRLNVKEQRSGGRVECRQGMSLRVAVCVHDAVAAIVQPARVDDVSTLWLKRPHAAGDVVEEVAARPRRSICRPVAKGRIHCPATCCVGVAAAHLGRTHGTHFVDGWRTRGSVAALVTQTLLVSIRVPMHFAIRVAPTTCVVRVAVASSAIFALRVAVAARIVSTASIAAGLDSKLVALAARIAVARVDGPTCALVTALVARIVAGDAGVMACAAFIGSAARTTARLQAKVVALAARVAIAAACRSVVAALAACIIVVRASVVAFAARAIATDARQTLVAIMVTRVVAVGTLGVARAALVGSTVARLNAFIQCGGGGIE